MSDFVSTTPGSTTNILQDNIDSRNNENLLRSQFAATSFPLNPVEGQSCYRTDINNGTLYIYNGTTWVMPDANSTIGNDVTLSKGQLSSLNAFLRVSHNDDGTLKNPATANVSEWVSNDSIVPTYVSGNSFTVNGNQTTILTANRAIKATLDSTVAYSYVLAVAYDTVTTVTLTDSVLDSGLQKVEYGIINKGLPSNVALKNTDGKFVGDITGDAQSVQGVTADKIALSALYPTNYIADGGTVTPGTGLNVLANSGKFNISNKYQELIDQFDLALDARMASLIYAQKSDTSVPIVGKVNAVYPEPDDNTVAQWRFNQHGDVNVPNYAVGKSAIAVANDLVPHGGLTQVDGHCDYAIKGDGNTGYYVSQNSSGFPVGTAECEIDILLSDIVNPATAQSICIYGGIGSANQNIGVSLIGGQFQSNSSSSNDFAYTPDSGKLYLINVHQTADGYTQTFVNGILTNRKAYARSLQAAVFNVLQYIDGTNWSASKIHFIELRNKCRTPAQIASMANKLCLPCSYTAPSASYPTISATDLASAYHEYKFDEASGNAVADSAGTLSGTATGTTIVDSEIGLGKARKFNGTASDGITLGNYGFTNDFTCMICGKVSDLSIARRFLDNRINFLDGMSIGLLDSTGKIYVTNNSSNVLSSTTLISANMPFFIVVSSKSGIVSTYINSYTPEILGTLVTSTATHPLYFGRDSGNAGNWHKGSLDYLAIIPRALSQAEIAQYYDALMNKEKKDIRSILPSDSISLGRVRTDSTAVIEINDSDYQYGRREKAVGGNRKKFLGWKYFDTKGTNMINLDWSKENPFGTRKVNTKFVWAQDANGTNESDVLGLVLDTNYYGFRPVNTVSNRILINIGSGGVTNFNLVNQTSGYIGCYCECIEEDDN